MGYKQRAKQVYIDLLPLIEEYKELEKWWQVENAKWQERKKKTRHKQVPSYKLADDCPKPVK